MELSFLKEKILQIDEYVGKKDKEFAMQLIDDVLDLLPESCEIYWKKLLAETGSKDPIELLCNKDKLLQNYPAFNNANKKQEYESVKKAENLIAERLGIELVENEPKVKCKTGAEKKLREYKEELNKLKTTAQKNIVRLELKEREIRELSIDCKIIAGEHRYAFENLLSKAENISNKCNDEISKKEKDIWEAELGIILEESNLEYEELQNVFSSHPKFIEHKRLVNEQKTIYEEINHNLQNLDKLNKNVEQLVSSIDEITEQYAVAKKSVRNGNYAEAKMLLTSEKFVEIVEYAVSMVKIGENQK